MESIAGLRWILLGLGLAFLLGLTLWETWRSRRASHPHTQRSGRAVQTEPSLGELPEEPAEVTGLQAESASWARPLQDSAMPGSAIDSGMASSAVQSSPMPEPCTQESEDQESAALAGGPPVGLAAAAMAAPAFAVPPAAAGAQAAAFGVSPAPAAPQLPASTISVPPAAQGTPLVEWPPEGERQIVSVRIVAADEERLSGRAVRQALAACGFVHGRYRIFHQPLRDGRVLLSCASLSKPGSFDPVSMDFQRFAGLSLFAVLPGPLPAAEAVEGLLEAAQDLAERLQARLQDDHGRQLDSAGIALVRQHACEPPGGAAPSTEPTA